jgi:hypothetical protein
MFARISDRFGWTPEQIGDLNAFQISMYLEWLQDNPIAIVGAVDPPKPGSKRRRR